MENNIFYPETLAEAIRYFSDTDTCLNFIVELMPFFALEISHKADIQMSNPSGLSSMIVPTFTLNCFLQPLHFHILRVEMNVLLADWQRGHTTPSAHRSSTMNLRQVSASEKYRIASASVSG